MENKTNEIKTFFSRCRCCLEYGYLKCMWSEYTHNGEPEVYGEMLANCFALSWDQPKNSTDQDQICERCVQRLRDASDFKTTVLTSQEKLTKGEGGITGVVKEEYLDETLDSDDESKYLTHPTDFDDHDDSSYDPDDESDISRDRSELEFKDEIKTEMEYEVEYLEDDEDSKALFSNTSEANDASNTSRRKRQRRTKEGTTEQGDHRKWPKKLPKHERHKTYKQYTQEDMRKCLEAVKSQKLTATEASKKYGVPRKTIRAKLRSDPKHVQNDKTTTSLAARVKMRQSKLKTTQHRKGPTIFRHASKIDEKTKKSIEDKKLKAKNIQSTTTVQTKIPEDNDKTAVDIDIKSEEVDTMKTPVNVDNVRVKYMALVNDKLKEESNDDTPVLNEMDKHKDNIKTLLQNSNATMIKAYWSVGYSCYFCDEIKNTPLELKQHNLEVHTNEENIIKVKYVTDLVLRVDITGLICKLCEESINSLEDFMDHLRNTHSKIIHVDIKNHIIPFKFDTNIFQCIKCRKEFQSLKLLSEHMSVHYGNYECESCDRTFINKQSLLSHSYRHKSGVFKCSHCPKVFDTRPKKTVHERAIHVLSNRSRKCAYCDERFSNADILLRHQVKVHGVEPKVYSCQACNKSYNRQTSLLTHKKRFHLMIRPHKCSYCDMTFYSSIELQSHTVTHTKTREFKCDICGKNFGTKCSLNQHVRGHLNDRKFKCDVCERTFVHRTAWKVHMRGIHAKIV